MRCSVAPGCRLTGVIEERFVPGGEAGERRLCPLGPRGHFRRRHVVVERAPRQVAGDPHEARPRATGQRQAKSGGERRVDLGRRVGKRGFDAPILLPARSNASSAPKRASRSARVA